LKIYTKTGDLGETSLLGGTRVPKDHLRVVAYGDVDETNAALGAVCAFAGEPLRRLLSGVQRDLFAIGAQLADPTHRVAAKRAKAAVTAAHVRRLERRSTRGGSSPLRSFVAGGTRRRRCCTTRARSAAVRSGPWSPRPGGGRRPRIIVT
jgi:cob(I)alamin adenosyltransferase